MNEDFRDVLAALLRAEARFLVVGAHAMAVHGVPRATGDLAIWIEAKPKNAERVWGALVAFGAPMETGDVTREDLCKPGIVVQVGLPPRRIDILTDITGVEFTQAWDAKVTHAVGLFRVPFVGRDTLVANKRARGRLKDLADLEALGESPELS